MDVPGLTDPARLSAVRALAILDTPPEPEYDDLATIAAAVCQTPWAAVTVVAADRDYVKAAVGSPDLPGRSFPVHRSLCGTTIEAPDGLLVVCDTRTDPRVADRLGGAASRVGYYIGAAIRHRGQPVAVVCAFSPESRRPREGEVEALTALARQASGHLEMRRRTEEWRSLASTDALTGLANRRLLFESMGVALGERRMGEDVVGLLFCDIDRFKAINDRFGHEAGDRLLCEVAQRLRAAVRDTDVVARIAGDEFVVLCPRLAGPEALALATARVRAVCDEPFSGPVGELRLSVGGVLAQEGEPADAVLARADAVMYADKSAHRAASASAASPPA